MKERPEFPAWNNNQSSYDYAIKLAEEQGIIDALGVCPKLFELVKKLTHRPNKGLRNVRVKDSSWVVELVKAIKPGIDTSRILDRWLFSLLQDKILIRQHIGDEKGDLAVYEIVELFRRRLNGDEPDKDKWSDASWKAYCCGMGDTPIDGTKVAQRAANTVWGTQVKTIDAVTDVVNYVTEWAQEEPNLKEAVDSISYLYNNRFRGCVDKPYEEWEERVINAIREVKLTAQKQAWDANQGFLYDGMRLLLEKAIEDEKNEVEV